MEKKYNKYSPIEKMKIVLESCNNVKYGDIKKIAMKYGISPNVLYNWRCQFFSEATANYVFNRKTISPLIDLNNDAMTLIVQQQFIIESLKAQLEKSRNYPGLISFAS